MRRTFPVLLALFLFLGTGCARDQRAITTKIVGRVTFNGDPLRDGRIVLRAIEPHSLSTAGVIENGIFTMEAALGPKRVEIVSYRKVPGMMTELNPGEEVPIVRQVIPEQFNRESTLIADIHPNGDRRFSFDLIETRNSSVARHSQVR
ncbi:hypothetical protein Pan216_57110 [Planctomycetes bacterium Pan216]|uniref:DUF4369 domain-containing protein n=1 Tax=Kolteria novifilia TaxID=2527975 RepID=A0A518BCV9_9BACT|nr:hypothetical protein Pan216_57110 [Planctomycetes bacterium Pan216]